MGKYGYQKCKNLDAIGFCEHGCSIMKGKRFIMCHKFARGQCKYTSRDCTHGLHRPACFRSEPKQATPAQSRGDGFRPYKKDTEEDERLKGYLATLMLSRRIEDLVDLDGELVDSLYRKLAAKRHPDKDANEEAGRRFIELQTAREEVKKKLPFRMPFC